jgi:cytochrome b561
MELPKRYHPALVTLHWLIALLIFVNLYLGIFTLRNRGGARGFQAAGSNVAIHMAVGVTILVLLVARFILRVRTSKPAPATAGNKFLDLLAVIVHYGLYLAVLVVTVLGLVFSFQSGRFQSTFLGTQSQFSPPPGGFPAVNGTPGAQPAAPFNGSSANRPDFAGGRRRPGGGFALSAFHGLAAFALLGLVVLHILAALYHQFMRRDNLISRMWYGAK